jgi:hypothetical protein
MEDKTNLRLTAAEMSGLWTQYINDTLAICVNRYFLEIVEDEEIRPIIERTLKTANENVSMVKEIFKKDEFPIPVGFTEQDVNPRAERLFSDSFILVYLRQMSMLAMAANCADLGVVTRPDIVDFHKQVFKKAIDLQDMIRDLMLKQGIYIKPPYITIPDKVEFVEKQHFLAGFFGKKRALTTVEITHLFLNIQANAIGKVLMTGFAQITKNNEVKQFLVRGKELSHKYAEIFSDFLKNEDLPAPMNWDAAVKRKFVLSSI